MDRYDEVRATRRAMLCAACALPLLAACGDSDPAADPVTGVEDVPAETPSSAGSPTSRASGDPLASGSATPSKAPVTRAAGGETSPGAATRTPGGTTSAPTPKPSVRPTASATPTTSPEPPGALVKVSEVPVGGGVVLRGEGIVVTRPSSGEFRGFSNVCTHRSQLVDRVSGGEISCPAHGSQFSIVNGAVTQGPATKPLPARAVVVRSGWVCRA